METKKSLNICSYLRTNTFKDKNVIITGALGAIGSEVFQKLLLCGTKILGFIHKQNI